MNVPLRWVVVGVVLVLCWGGIPSCVGHNLESDGGGRAVQARLPFKCRRSFDQQLSIKPKHLPMFANCWFGPLEIVSASASQTFHDGSVALRFSMTAAIERPMPNATYTITLRHVESGARVDYHGFDDNGYSLCCQFAEHSRCGWAHAVDPASNATVMVQRVEDCPLERPAEAYPVADSAAAVPEHRVMLSGHVTKPLPVMKGGRWEVDFRMKDFMQWRLGQVLAWADVSVPPEPAHAHLPPAALHSSKHHEAPASLPQDGAMVPSVLSREGSDRSDTEAAAQSLPEL
eukprot:RCo026991